MNSYTEEVGKKLNILLEKTYDAEKGFQKASEHAESGDLKMYFKRKTEERYTFGQELKSEISKFYQEIDKGGSLTGAMHRSWIDVKAWFSGDNDETMLEEAISGEKAAIEEYEDVLKAIDLPPSTTNLLTKQRNAISSNLANIKRLEDVS